MSAKKLTRQGRARKEQLMAEAAKLFAQSGYYATRVIDIVKSAGVAKGLFYWYFENKEALFREIVKATREDLRRAQARAIDGVEDPLQRILRGVDASLRFMSDNRNLYALLRFAGTQEQFASLVDDAQELSARDTSRHIEEAMARGLLPPGDALVMAHGIVATVFHFARLRASGRIVAPLDEMARTVSAFCLRSIGAEPARYGLEAPPALKVVQP